MANIRKRSGDAFAQVDNYLIALKMLGIPSGEIPTLDAMVSANDSAKIFFNTLKKAFQVYVDGAWIDTEVDLSDYYNKQEVDNLISGIINGMDWKAAVATYDDLATEYPSPEQGWTVTVNDESVIYQYDGSQWVDIGDMLIPMADATRDGRMSKEDFVKLRDIEAEATKNRSDAYLLNRGNFEGEDPISSIEGASAAPNNSIPAKKGDGTYGWVNYSAPKPAGIRKPNGSIIYFDTLIDAMFGSWNDPSGANDILEIYTDTTITETLYLEDGRRLNMNGYSLHSTKATGRAIQIDDWGGSRSKIINGNIISSETSGYTIYILSVVVDLAVIDSDIESLNGSAIYTEGNLRLKGDIIAKNTPIASYEESFVTADVKGNITSIEDIGWDSLSGIVYGNITTFSEFSPSIRIAAGNNLTVFGDIIVENETSESPAVLFSDGAPGGMQDIALRISGSILPSAGLAAAAINGNWHNCIITFLGMQSYKGDIQETDKPIIVNAEVPFPEIGNDGIEDIIAGTNISIDKTDPKNPVINSTAGGGDGYETPEEVRDALSELTGENRLDANAIKNLPSTGLTLEQEAKLENAPLDTISELDNKVDKEEGKGLSSNDYTLIEKNKLVNIEEEAQKNVQSDWNQENSNSDDFIKNKPSLFSGSFNDLDDVPSSFPSTIEDVNGLEAELIDLQDQITTNENKLEYVLNFPSDVLNYDFKETIDIKINSIKIEPESGQTVDLGGYILGETLEAYTVLSISVNQGGIIELIGERV